MVFTKKGYAATRTRDIAEKAGINLALLNYYFRSKEKLFHIIMEEKFHKLFDGLFPILNNAEINLKEKIAQVTDFYIDSLIKNPDLPIFVLGEIRNHPGHFVTAINLKSILSQSSFVKQLHKKRPEINPIQFILSILGMVIFPFVARPVFEATGLVDKKEFNALLLERKKLIPVWTNAMLKAG